VLAGIELKQVVDDGLISEFGVRLEDHVYITEDGPRWFTQPSPSIDRPFA